MNISNSSPALILVDVGNTSSTLGLAVKGRITHTGRVPTHAPHPLRSYRESLRNLLGRQKATDAILCSVVPAKNRTWIRVLKDFTGRPPLVVSNRIDLGIKIRYPHPASIGADRLANASAVVAWLGAPAIVADFGTALTFDVIAPDGAYVGGVIAPGLPLMTRYLAERTALLPQIALEGRFGNCGRSTEEAMRIGALIGYRGLVREILMHLNQGFPQGKPHLAATGGYAAQALKGLNLAIRVDPNLTLKGLLRIYRMNRCLP